MEFNYNFHQFPYRKLKLKVPRRAFMMSLLKEVNGTVRAAGQKPTFRMADLGEMETENIFSVIPALYPGIKFQKDPHFVVAKAPQHMEYIHLCPRGSAAHTLLQFFNLKLTLITLSEKLSEQHKMNPKLAIEYTRGFFLFLVESGFSYPAGGTPNET